MKKIKCLLLVLVLVTATVGVYQPAFSKANYTVNKKALKRMAKKTFKNKNKGNRFKKQMSGGNI